MSVTTIRYFDPEVVMSENVSAPNQSVVDTNAGENAVQGTVAEADTSDLDDNIAQVASEAGYDGEGQKDMDDFGTSSNQPDQPDQPAQESQPAE